MLNPIALAIPAFFAAMGAELALSAWRGRLTDARPTWRFVDAISDLACGISSQVTGQVLGTVIHAGVYVATYDALALTSLPDDSVAVWIGAFIALDFFYYLWHRASHRVNILWAAHVVHHQSEDFNLAVALRQAMFTPLTSIPFYLPLAVIGVPPIVFLTCAALNTLYQFWFHTRLVGRTPWLDGWLNTPTHHRVHHGIEPEYIDKNHAGVFIVWDRLFGTFEPEGREPTYGTVEGFATASVLRANLEPYTKLFWASMAAKGGDRLRIWFAPPEWRPSGPVSVPVPTAVVRWTPTVSPRLAAYVGTWLVLASAGLFVFLLGVPEWPVEPSVGVGLAVLLTTVAWGPLLEARPRMAMELTRLALLPLLLLPFGVEVAVAALAVATVSSVALIWAAKPG